jgi:hypothetical protein
MIRRIKDRLILFMTKHLKNSVLFLLWVLLCLSVPLKSAYATCGLVNNCAGCGGYWGVCTTEAEAQSYISTWSCDITELNKSSDGTGTILCCSRNIWQFYGQPPGTLICYFSVNFGNTCTDGNTQSCTTSNGCPGTQTCSNGHWGDCQSIDPCCGSNDPCCGIPNCCPVGGSGGGSGGQ